jgi:hypothetical protein
MRILDQLFPALLSKVLFSCLFFHTPLQLQCFSKLAFLGFQFSLVLELYFLLQ